MSRRKILVAHFKHGEDESCGKCTWHLTEVLIKAYKSSCLMLKGRQTSGHLHRTVREICRNQSLMIKVQLY